MLDQTYFVLVTFFMRGRMHWNVRVAAVTFLARTFPLPVFLVIRSSVD